MREQRDQLEQVQALLDERRGVLRRALRALPDRFLRAMAAGLERHRERLVPGRLYASADGGGCAVGVMLRELEPETYARRRVRFWLRDRWRRGSRSYHDAMGQNPRLKHLEWVFDDAVKLLRSERGLTRRTAGALAGDWVREEIGAELRWRELRRTATSPAAAPSRALGAMA